MMVGYFEFLCELKYLVWFDLDDEEGEEYW